MPTFREFLGSLDDFLGDDEEYLGARPRGVRRISAPARQQTARAVQTLTPVMQGVPKEGARIEPVGFPLFSFVNAGATSITQITRPMKPFKGSRLILDIARTAGATAQAALIQVTAFKIGARDVLVNSNPIGSAVFGPLATNVELMMDEVTPGVEIALTLGFVGTALAVGETVTCQATILGLTLS